MAMWNCPKQNMITCQVSYKLGAKRGYLVLGSETPLYRRQCTKWALICEWIRRGEEKQRRQRVWAKIRRWRWMQSVLQAVISILQQDRPKETHKQTTVIVHISDDKSMKANGVYYNRKEETLNTTYCGIIRIREYGYVLYQ